VEQNSTHSWVCEGARCRDGVRRCKIAVKGEPRHATAC
jgi:hypothetical protein